MESGRARKDARPAIHAMREGGDLFKIGRVVQMVKFWTVRQEEILRERGHLGAEAVADAIFAECGVRRTVRAAQQHAHLIRAHVLEQSITGIARALLHIVRGFGADLPHEGDLKVMFDDSIITDTFQEKKQDLSEVGVTMSVAEFRAKWYGEPLDVAEERAGKLGA